MPIIQESAGLQRAYTAELRRFLNSAAKAVREIIITSYRTSNLTRDTNADDYERLEKVFASLLRVAQDSIADLLTLEAIRHTDRFSENARRAFGIDLKGVVTSEDLTDYVEQVAIRNAGLIKGMSDDLIKKIKNSTVASTLAGDSVGKLQKKLKSDLGVSDARARLIARDQTAKLNSDLNKKRHQQAGIKKYKWRTSKDERVRAKHRRLDGNIYEYDQPTGAENGQEPGQPIQCRCFGQALVEFGNANVETVGPKPGNQENELEFELENSFVHEGEQYSRPIMPMISKQADSNKVDNLRDAVALRNEIHADLMDELVEMDRKDPVSLRIDPRILKTEQPWIVTDKVNKIAKNFDESISDDLPVVLKFGDTYVLKDGNHRVSAAILSGQKDIKVEIREFVK